MPAFRPLALLLAVCWTITGCASPAKPLPPPTSLSLNRNLSIAPKRWTIEAQKRFKQPVIFACHGGTIAGVWVCEPDGLPPLPTDGVALLLKKIYGDRPIVLVVCNAAGNDCHVRGVWFARKIVWTYPGVDRRITRDGIEYGTGSIWEFEEGK